MQNICLATSAVPLVLVVSVKKREDIWIEDIQIFGISIMSGPVMIYPISKQGYLPSGPLVKDSTRESHTKGQMLEEK